MTGMAALGILVFLDSQRAIANPTAAEFEIGKTFYSRFTTCFDAALNGRDVTQPVHDLAHSSGEFLELLNVEDNYRKTFIEQIQSIPYR